MGSMLGILRLRHQVDRAVAPPKRLQDDSVLVVF